MLKFVQTNLYKPIKIWLDRQGKMCYNYYNISVAIYYYCAIHTKKVEAVDMSRTKIITISRKFGSGGREIGKIVAESLGINFYDKEIITAAAKNSGLCDKFVESIDERPTGSLLYSLVMNSQHGGFAHNKPIELIAYEAQIDAVREAAEHGACVIVGRAADYILKDNYDIVSAFVTAPIEVRAKTVMARDNITEKEAVQKINRLDKARASYYNYHTETKWGSADSYDICINTECIDKELAAKLIIDYYNSKQF